jgi:hypothetical protein
MVLARFDNGKISSAELDAEYMKLEGDSNPPMEVKASPRFSDDVFSLSSIFDSTLVPPQVQLRSKRIVTVIYGFGDASDQG